jgi:hypothetical protein
MNPGTKTIILENSLLSNSKWTGEA